MSSRLINRFKFFKLENINGSNNWVLFDTQQNKFHNEISLVNISDILQDREFIEIYNLVNPYTPLKKNIKLSLQELQEKKKSLVEQQKQIFQEVKNLVLINKINIDSLIYEPTEKKLITKNGNKYFNVNKFICPYSTKPQKEYKFPMFEKLLRNILQEGYNKFLCQMAYKKQHPTSQIPCNWIIQDEGGTGKTEILGDFLLEKLFGINIADQEDLESSFTPFLVGAPYLMFEEIEGYEDEKKIKKITGAKKHLIKEKYEKGFYSPNYQTIIINSNELRTIKITENDRRFNIVGGGKRLSPIEDTPEEWQKTLFGSKEENEKFFKKFHENYEKELNEINAYISNLQVTRLDVQIPLKTKKKEELIKMNYNSEQEFLNEILENGLDGIIFEYHENNYQYFINNNLITNLKQEIHFTIKGFYKLYCDFCRENKLRQVAKKNFLVRLSNNDLFIKLFEKNIIRINDKVFKSLKINLKYKNKLFKLSNSKENINPNLDILEELNLSEI